MTTRASDTSIDPVALGAGKYQELCPDCGSTTVGATLGAVCSCQGRPSYRYLTQLACMLCSREVATVVTRQPNAPILVPRHLRCRECGGQPLAGETFRQVVYPSVPFEQPRRGRPPRWLVEQRRLERSAS